MSVRPGAPYADRVEENGKVLIYEGHDVPRKESPNPKSVDQQMNNGDRLTQNGLFYNAAIAHKEKKLEPEIVRVYEKIRSGIWVFNGLFKLIDSWKEKSGNREVFKFRLEIADNTKIGDDKIELDHTRIIPTNIKIEVWKRDKGRCVKCQSADNLHFDHILPYSRGGTSLKAENIQILCARHNLQKRDKIE